MATTATRTAKAKANNVYILPIDSLKQLVEKLDDMEVATEGVL